MEINRRPVNSADAYNRLAPFRDPGDVLAVYVYMPGSISAPFAPSGDAPDGRERRGACPASDVDAAVNEIPNSCH